MNYIQQAYKGDNTWWKVWFTTLLTTGIFILNFVFYLFTTAEDLEEAYNLMKQMPTNISLIVNLLPFAVLLALLFLCVKFLHERSLLSLTTVRKKVDVKRILVSFSLIVVFTLVTFLISYSINSSEIVFQFQPVKFLILFIISVLLFPFQIGFEEYVFRGYLMQQIGIFVKNKWMPLIITSVLFGLAHSANPEVAALGFVTMIFYIGTGLLLGIMTLMDDGLELALGFHLGNNLMAALLVTSDWSALQTDAVFRYTSEQATQTLMEILIPILVFYPVFLIILGKIYKWSNWKERLFGKVTKPLVLEEDIPLQDQTKEL